MTPELLIIGRGPSLADFDLGGWHGDTMAVSSGIYAMPEERPPDHFVSLDGPKFFMGALRAQTDTEYRLDGDGEYRRIRAEEPLRSHAWHSECEAWPFWSYAEIAKHVNITRAKRGHFRTLPDGMLDEMPSEYLRPFIDSIASSGHMLGYQPSWGDFPNVVGWECDTDNPVNFGATGALGGTAGAAHTCNSLTFAVQVAHRLGYRQIGFVGTDMVAPIYHRAVDLLERCWDIARDDGAEWVSYNYPESPLSAYLPACEVVR